MPGKALKVWEIITRPWTWPWRSRSVPLGLGRSLPSDATAAKCYKHHYDDDDDDAVGFLSASGTPRGAAMAPKGCITVYVGADRRRRFVIPAEAVNHGLFRQLLDEAEREYGFHNDGPLTLPCEVGMFRDVLCQILWPSTPVLPKKWCRDGRLLRDICLQIGIAAS